MFHGTALLAAGVTDPLDLPAPRFFRMADRLHLRGGAVTCRLAEARAEQADPVGAPPPAAESLPDITEVLGVSGPNSRGFPWIEYKGPAPS